MHQPEKAGYLTLRSIQSSWWGEQIETGVSGKAGLWNCKLSENQTGEMQKNKTKQKSTPMYIMVKFKKIRDRMLQKKKTKSLIKKQELD